MGGLLGLLDLGGNAILAQDAGIAVAGRNTSNVNTLGYSRETVDLESELGAPLVGGVTARGLARSEDLLLAARERLGAGALGRSDQLATALSAVEKDLAQPSQGLSHGLASLFASFEALSSAPLDDSRRAAVVAAADALAGSFRDSASALVRARADSAARVTSFAQQATLLTAKIAAANHALATTPDPVLADQRDQAAHQLAELTGGQARIDPDGKMRFVAGSGAVLVDGDTASTIGVSPDPGTPGSVRVQVTEGTITLDVTASLDGGRIAGEIAFSGGALATAQSDLDALAGSVINQINSVHSANNGLDGKNGRNLFQPTPNGQSAAATFSIDPGVASDPRQIATARPGQGPSDNGGLNALIALRDQPLAGGGTRSFIDESIHAIAQIGVATQAAGQARDLDAARSDVLRSARDSVSGVSTEDELQRLAQYQHAAEAAQKFVATVNDLLTSLIDKL